MQHCGPCPKMRQHSPHWERNRPYLSKHLAFPGQQVPGSLVLWSSCAKGVLVLFPCRFLEMSLFQTQVPELPALLYSTCSLWSSRQGVLQVTSRWSCFPCVDPSAHRDLGVMGAFLGNKGFVLKLNHF